ncbi:MAG: phosphoribosylamine--glycine ligase [Deltaproteobacteria bacterium]
MKALVIGGGAREHALCWKIRQSPLVKEVLCAPGNAGISKLARCVNIKVSDIDGLIRLARAEEIDLVVVGPELPLSLGIVDRFQAEGMRIFGPAKAAAQIESSKAFAKNLMKKYKIPTAFYAVFDNFDEAMNWVREVKPPLVVKADGLAAGKGVVICRTEREAEDALDAMMRAKIFGDASAKVVIEEFLEGEEASYFAFTDGEAVVPLEACQDHKALLDGDRGPNTGGMGAYSPAPLVTPDVERKIIERIMIPTVRAMKAEGIPYKGVLFAGLMIKNGEPQTLEFNCRFGDPEAQPLLMRMKSDIVPIINSVIDETLADKRIEWREEASVCVVMAAAGYPGEYKRGIPIGGIADAESFEGVRVFHAGTAFAEGQVVTDGGRVLGVTALGRTIGDAISLAYEGVGRIDCKSLYYRTDIGRKALRGNH